MSSTITQLPLFPLHTVLFPGGPLPLRIFEPRYLDMISHCLKTSTDFGVGLILDGKEVGKAAVTYEIGTIAHIVDWTMRDDGLLGITAIGQQRYRIQNAEVRPNQLVMAEVELLPEPPSATPDHKYLRLINLLQKIMKRADRYYSALDARYEDAAWVSYRLAELLPIGVSMKQYLLQVDTPQERLAELDSIVDGLGIL